MPISQANQVDYLFKKIGYAVTTTANASVKSPSNESIPSPLTLRGDNIWVQSGSIPGTQPGSSAGVLTVYNDASSNTVKTTSDSTSPSYQTWKTGITNWVDPSFGSTYQVKVYWDSTSSSTPQSTGTQLFPDGTGNDDEWFFDYDSGVLTFPDNIPSSVNGVAGKTIYIVGSVYSGALGLANAAVVIGGTVGTANVAYLDSVSSTSSNSTFYPALYNATSGNLSSYATSTITVNPSTGNLSAGNVLATVYGNVNSAQGTFANITTASGLFWANGVNALAPTYGNTQVAAYLPTYSGNLNPGNVISTHYGNVHADYIYGNTGNIVTFAGSGAIQIPVGNTAQQPSGASGMMRFNTDVPALEYYEGTSWVPVTNTVTDQQIIPDGVSTTFTLTQQATTVGVIVSINGTLQQPTVAYSVLGNQITFTEVPLVTDIVDVRFLGAAVTINNTLSENLSVTGNVTVTGLFQAPLTTQTSTSPGVAGQITWDANYIYVCTATNTWKRVALTGGIF
jgi:hypothetical protein